MRIIYLFFALLLTCSACNKKSKESDPSPSDNGGGDNVPKGTLLLHLHNYLDETEVDGYNIVYTTSEGRKILLTKAQLYLSNFELVKLDGSSYSISDKYILKLQENQVYQLGDVPVGNYKGIRFRVGLSPALNAITPSTSSSDILNRPDMWFGGAAQPDGYVFLHVAGKIDTTAAANATNANMTSFQYRIGTNAQYRQITMPDKNYTVVTNQVQYVHMYVDYVKLFDGINLTDEDNLMMVSPSDNATALGIKLGDNLSHLFLYED